MANDIFTAFKASALCDKNINFLIGSGASASYIPTLMINEDKTYEDILTDVNYSDINDLILHSYYKNILKRVFVFTRWKFITKKTKGNIKFL